VLRGYVTDKTPAIRQAAVYALARVKDSGVLADLVAMKADPDAVIRAQVAFAMSGADHPEAEAILIGYLDDFEQPVKLNAIKAVRERKMVAAFPKVKNLVVSRSLDIRREVVKTIMVLSQPGEPSLFETYQELLYDQDAEIRLMAVTGLSNYAGDPRVAPAVGGAVTDDDLAVKLKAIGVLGQTAEPNAVEQVIRGLFDATKDARQVKMAALDALESIGLPRAVKAIQEFVLNETDKVVIARANEVLQKL
jgi:HEAT repeat protein